MKHFLWTPQADLALRRMLASRFTHSGVAQRLGCRRLDVIARAAALGLTLSAIPNSKLASEIAQAQKARAA